MFGGFGIPELLIVLVIVLVFFGAGKLPEIGSALGKGIRGFRQSMESGDGNDQASQGAPTESLDHEPGKTFEGTAVRSEDEEKSKQ